MNDAIARGLEAMIPQILPVMVIQCYCAIGAFVISKKRGVNPWPWTVVFLVPFIGLIAVPVFLYVMVGAIFDRLRDLEGKSTGE